jgi:hypothetical protein
MFLHVTSRVPNRKNDGLFSDKGGSAFPSFMYLDHQGGVLAANRGGMDIARMSGAFQKKATDRRSGYVALEKKAADGDEKAVTRLAVLRLEMRSLSLADFCKAYPDLSKLDEGSRDSVLGLMGMEAFGKASKTVRAAGRDEAKSKEAFLVAGEILMKAAKIGAEPSDEQTRLFFFFYLGRAGTLHDRADMLTLAVDALKDEVEGNPRLATQYEQWVTKLKELKTTPPKDAK